MLSISVNTSKSSILPYCKACLTPYNEGLYLYEAKDKDEVLGTCLFEISGEQVEARYYQSCPMETHVLMDGVLRAGFNYAAEHGILHGTLSEGFRRKHNFFFKQLNYPNELTFNIQNFFSKYKNCSSPHSGSSSPSMRL